MDHHARDLLEIRQDGPLQVCSQAYTLALLIFAVYM